MVVTIIATTGSTPAAALSKMLVKRGGLVSVGTVGGGCMEGDVLMHARRLEGTGKAEILTFHLNEDDVEHGLICGGTLDVLIEPATREQLPLIRTIQSLRNEGKDCIIATHIKDGSIASKFPVNDEASIRLLASRIARSSSDVVEELGNVARRQDTVRIATSDGTVVLEPVPGNPSLVIFGGGHVSKFVSRTASMCGFRVTIIDDREKFSNAVRFPEAAQTIVADFIDVFSDLHLTASSYLLIVTRGHRYDTAILRRAIDMPVRYIGMIGSKRKVLTAFDQLRQAGIPDEKLQRIHSPVGLDIGSVTAEEIAVSIVAELIALRRGAGTAVRHKSDELGESPQQRF